MMNRLFQLGLLTSAISIMGLGRKLDYINWSIVAYIIAILGFYSYRLYSSGLNKNKVISSYMRGRDFLKFYLDLVLVKIVYRKVILLISSKGTFERILSDIEFRQKSFFCVRCITGNIAKTYVKGKLIVIVIQFEVTDNINDSSFLSNKFHDIEWVKIVSYFRIVGVFLEISATLLIDDSSMKHSTKSEGIKDLVLKLTNRSAYYIPIKIFIINLIQAEKLSTFELNCQVIKLSSANAITVFYDWYRQEIANMISMFTLQDPEKNTQHILFLWKLFKVNVNLIKYLQPLLESHGLANAISGVEVNYLLNQGYTQLVASAITRQKLHKLRFKPIYCLSKLNWIKCMSSLFLLGGVVVSIIVTFSWQYSNKLHLLRGVKDRVRVAYKQPSPDSLWNYVELHNKIKMQARSRRYSLFRYNITMLNCLDKIEATLLKQNLLNPIKHILQAALLQFSSNPKDSLNDLRFKYYAIAKWFMILENKNASNYLKMIVWKPKSILSKINLYNDTKIVAYTISHFNEIKRSLSKKHMFLQTEIDAILNKFKTKENLKNILTEIRSDHLHRSTDYSIKAWDSHIKPIICHIEQNKYAYYRYNPFLSKQISVRNLRQKLLHLYMDDWQKNWKVQIKKLIAKILVCKGMVTEQLRLEFFSLLRNAIYCKELNKSSVDDICNKPIASESRLSPIISVVAKKFADINQLKMDILELKRVGNNQSLIEFIRKEISDKNSRIAMLVKSLDLHGLSEIDVGLESLIKQLVYEKVKACWLTIYDYTTKKILQDWSATVERLYRKSVLEKYPFDLHAAEELSLSDFEEMAHPINGKIVKFHHENIDGVFADNKIAFFPFQLYEPANIIEQIFNNSLRLYQLFFNSQGIKFSIYPHPSPYVSEFHFALEDKHFHYQNEPQEWVDFNWHVKTHKNIAIIYFRGYNTDKDIILEQTGPWCLIKLFQTAHIKKIKGHTYQLRWFLTSKHKRIPINLEVKFHPNQDIIQLFKLS